MRAAIATILAGALALLAACGGASKGVDAPGANTRQDPNWHDSRTTPDSYTPARDADTSRKTKK